MVMGTDPFVGAFLAAGQVVSRGVRDLREDVTKGRLANEDGLPQPFA